MTQEGVESPTRHCASAVFAEGLVAQVNQSDVELIIKAQKHMMCRFEKTNEMLINCNALSTVRCHIASQEFKRHTQLLIEMKKDLDSIFKRIRVLKMKLNSQYPQAFQAVSQESASILEDEVLPEESRPTSVCNDIPTIAVTAQDEPGSSSCPSSAPSPAVSSSSADTT